MARAPGGAKMALIGLRRCADGLMGCTGRQRFVNRRASPCNHCLCLSVLHRPHDARTPSTPLHGAEHPSARSVRYADHNKARHTEPQCKGKGDLMCHECHDRLLELRNSWAGTCSYTHSEHGRTCHGEAPTASCSLDPAPTASTPPVCRRAAWCSSSA